MKKQVFYIAMLLLFAGNLAAQEHQHLQRTPEEIAQKQTERLQRDLSLTEQQRDTIYKIHLKYANMRTMGENRAVVEQRMRTMTEELMPLLNAEQQIRFRQFLSEIGPKRQSTPRMRVAEAVAVETDGSRKPQMITATSTTID